MTRDEFEKEIDKLARGCSEYEWDELEELITDSCSDEKITEEDFDNLMRKLNEIEP